MLSTRLLAAARRAASWRWPSLCAVRHGWGTSRLCAECAGRLAQPTPRCARCALPVPRGVATCAACVAAPPAFDAALARVDDAFPWDRLIAAFKFHGAPDLGPVLAEAMVGAYGEAQGREAPPPVVPVPPSDTRRREHGDNPAWGLARRVARRPSHEAEPRLLLRVRDTPHQLALPPKGRAGNVRGAFAIKLHHSGELRGRAIARVDDVMTTGGIAAAIVGVLKEAGAASVAVRVVARTPRPGEEE